MRTHDCRPAAVLLCLVAGACGRIDSPTIQRPQVIQDASVPADVPDADAGPPALPECTRIISENFPSFFNFFPRTPGPFPNEGSGAGVVTAIDRVEATIEVEGCCTFGVQRSPLPPMFEVGETLEVHFGYAAGFVDSDWGLTLLDAEGELKLFVYIGGFTRTRFDALQAPFDVEIEDVCSAGENNCYVGGGASATTVVAGDARLTLTSRQQGLLEVGDGMYQVHNAASGNAGIATGMCTDSLPPGEYMSLQIVPAMLEL